MRKYSLVIPIWDFVKSGGLRVLTELANNISIMGINVKIIAFYKNNKPYYPVSVPIEFVNEYGEVVKREDPPKQKKRIEAIKNVGIRVKALKKALDRNSKEYTCVLANFHLTTYAVKKCNIAHKFYYIQAYEAWYKKGIYNTFKNYVAKKTYSFDLIRIVNADLYKDYKEIKSKYVVPPGLNFDLYYNKSANKYWDGKRPLVIGHIGRTEEWKGSKDVAAAVKLLQGEGADIVYKVAFNPPEKDSCHFDLVKPDGDNNLAEYYRSVDVLVAPGHIQLGAIHYPVIEAMACGTPVITTGYYPANDDNAYIVSVKSPNEIANAIKSIMSDYSLAMSKVEKASQEIEAFSWDNVSKKMLSIIEENIN